MLGQENWYAFGQMFMDFYETTPRLQLVKQPNAPSAGHLHPCRAPPSRVAATTVSTEEARSEDDH